MITIHRHVGSPDLIPVNAYLVEADSGVVAVDGTLTVAGGRGLRERLVAIGKPLVAVLLTHAHPDHYGGIVELIGDDPVEIVAVAGVAAAVRGHDPGKESELRALLGDEWPSHRALPTRTVADGAALTLDGLTFQAIDLGPGESPHDSVWVLGEERQIVFAGDEIYSHAHGYLVEAMWDQWLGQLARLDQELPCEATLYPGHGPPAGVKLLAWQRDYIAVLVDAVRSADWQQPIRARAAVVERVLHFLPSSELRRFLEPSIDAVATKLMSQRAAC